MPYQRKWYEVLNVALCFNDIIEFYYKVSQQIKRDAVREPEALEMSSELSCYVRLVTGEEEIRDIL